MRLGKDRKFLRREEKESLSERALDVLAYAYQPHLRATDPNRQYRGLQGALSRMWGNRVNDRIGNGCHMWDGTCCSSRLLLETMIIKNKLLKLCSFW